MSDPVEDQVQAAIARGEFQDLPGSGRPLPKGDDGPGWWARRKVQQLRKEDEIRDLHGALAHQVDQLWAVASESEVRRRVADLNAEIGDINHRLDADDRLEPLDIEATLAVWRRMWRARQV